MNLTNLTTIRCAVGMLGESGNHAWWDSSFFSQSSSAFIAPLFPRSGLLAQHQGVKAAASLVHDDKIGVGKVFHLFRMPEDVERAIYELLQESAAVELIQQHLVDADAAMAFLGEPESAKVEPGPWRVADTDALRSDEKWQDVATRYAQAFEAGSEIFPYFADKT